MTVDVSGFSYFLPLLSFLVVFLISYAVMSKAGLFDNKFWQLFTSFLLAIIFVSAAGPTRYVVTIVPWFAILLVTFVLLLAFLGMFKASDKMKNGMGIGFVVVLLILFVISAIFVFASYLGPYLPWSSGYGGNPDVLHVTDWFWQPRVYGALLLLVIAGLVSWILAKAK